MTSVCRYIRILTITLLVAFSSSWTMAQTGDDPAVLVETQPLGELLRQAKSVGEVIASGGKNGAVEDFQTGWSSVLGENLEKLKSLDLGRPLGGYGMLNDKMMGAVLIPVADEKGFLELLGTLGIEAKPAQDGKYDVRLPPGMPPAQLRFADKYAHLAFGPTVLATGPNPIPAAKVFTAPAGKPSLLVVIRPDRISPLLRNLFLSAMQNSNDVQLNKRPGETEAGFKGRLYGQQLANDVIGSLVSESESLTYGFDLNKNGKLLMDLRVTPRAGTKQAEYIAAVGEAKAQPIEIPLPGKTGMIMSAAGAKFDGIRQAMLDAMGQEENPVGQGVLKILKKHWEVVPTDLAMRMNVAGDEPNFSFSIAIQDGEGLEKALREFVQTLPAEEQKQVQFNVAKANNLSIHSLTTSAEAPENPLFQTVYLGIGKNVIVLVGGKGTLEALQKAKTDGTPVRAMVFAEIAASVITNLPNSDPKKKARSAKLQPKVDALAKKLFTTPGTDKMLMTVTGGPSLLFRAEYDLPGIAFMLGHTRLETEAIFEAVSEELKTPEAN